MADTGNKPAELNLTPLRQGATFRRRFTLTNESTGQPVDITGWMFRGQIRKTASSTEIAAPVTFNIIDAANGVAEFVISAQHTAALVAGDNELAPQSMYVWDAEYDDALGDTHGLFFGNVMVFREVTR